jgi:hypothetical protein
MGGRSPFAFTQNAPTAAISSFGGLGIGIHSNDPANTFQNPALLNPSMLNKASLSYQNFLSDAGVSNVSTAIQIKKQTISLNLHSFQSGKFETTDPTGNSTGTFEGNETAVQLGWNKTLSPRWSGGIGVRYLGASYGFYHYAGLAAQIGFFYKDTSKNTTFAAVLDQAGAMLSAAGSGRESLPANLQLAYSKKLEHLPLRFQIGAQHLTQWNIRYYDPADPYYNPVTQTLGSAEPEPVKNYTFDKFFRHFTFGAELNLSKNLQARMGYNALRRGELTLPTKGGFTGFSFGFSLKTKRFDYSFARIPFALAGKTTQFSILFHPQLKSLHWF